MMRVKSFLRSKTAPDWVVLGILLLYLVKEIALMIHLGTAFGTDADSVERSVQGARGFLENGFGPTAGLAVYPGFVFETPVPQLLRTGVYTHYLPGPDYVLAAVFAFFGKGDGSIFWARLIPLALTLLSAWIFAQAAQPRIFSNWKWAKAWLLASLLAAPTFYIWSLNLHGHAYSTVCTLLGITLGLLAADPERETPGMLGIGMFCLGFISQYMLMTGSFVVFFSPAVGFLLHRKYSKPLRAAFPLCFWAGMGLVAAFALHFWQIAHYLQSWSLAWLDVAGTAVDRANGGPKTSLVELVGQYSDHARGFFRINSIHMLLIGLGAAWISLAEPAVRKRLALSLLLGFIGATLWIVTMRRHSIIHTHLNPRVYVLLYVPWLCVLISMAGDNVRSILRGNA